MRSELGMKSHPIAQEELMAYLDGELPTDQAAVALAHLERCPECRALAAELRSVSQKLMLWEIDPPDMAVPLAVTAALDERQQKPQAVNRQAWRTKLFASRWAWAGALAGVCVIVGLGLKATTLNRSVSYFASQETSRDSKRSFGGLGDKVARSTSAVNSQPFAGQRRIDAPNSAAAKAVLSAESQIDENLQNQPEEKEEAGDGSPTITGPMIVRTASLTVTTKNFDRARSSLDDILKQHRGYVGELSVNTAAGAARTFTATLRVPADQLEAALADLRKLGRVESESQSGEEVTAQYVDLTARLENARNTEQRLTGLLRQRTGKLSDVLAVENEIDCIRGEIERMQAERKNLAKQVSFATINATVAEDYKADLQVVPVTTGSRLHNAAVDGYQTMVDGVVGLVLFFFSYGPSLLLWGAVLFFPARFAWKKVRRNSP